MKIKIIVAERTELLRESLVYLLNSVTDFQVISTAEHGKELLEKMKHSQADIVLLNVDMPVMPAKPTLEVIQRRFEGTRVIMLASSSEKSLAAEYMALGACSFLTKDCSVDTLFKAIRTVHTEDYYFDASMSKAMLGAIIREKTSTELLEGVTFNKREREIMIGICDEKTNKQIASELNLSASTIDFHRTRIYTKAKCKNVAGLIKFAILKGIIQLTPEIPYQPSFARPTIATT